MCLCVRKRSADATLGTSIEQDSTKKKNGNRRLINKMNTHAHRTYIHTEFVLLPNNDNSHRVDPDLFSEFFELKENQPINLHFWRV